MENTLYYTFSTIAQALAGAIAFLGAFVLFRLQSLSQGLRASGEILGRVWLGDDEIQRCVAGSNYSSMLVRADQLVEAPVPSGWGAIHQAALEGLRLALTLRRKMLHGLAWVLLVTALVMAVAVLVLANVQWLVARPVLAAKTLESGMVAFVLCLLAIIALVWKVVRGA